MKNNTPKMKPTLYILLTAIKSYFEKDDGNKIHLTSTKLFKTLSTIEISRSTLMKTLNHLKELNIIRLKRIEGGGYICSKGKAYNEKQYNLIHYLPY